MKAKLVLEFENGEIETIELNNAIELNISEERPNSICFNETRTGGWVMTFTKNLFKGRKFKEIKCTK